MNYIFINTPNYTLPNAPISGIPTLLGILEDNGYNASFIDLNMKFVNYILRTKYLSEYFDFLKAVTDNKETYNYPSFINDVLENTKNSWNKHYSKIKILESHSKFILSAFNKMDYFLNPILIKLAYKMLFYSIEDIGTQFEEQFLRHIIHNIKTSAFYTDTAKTAIDIHKLKAYIESDVNILKKFYGTQIDEILSKQPDCIGITINIPNQFLPAFTLAYLLKQKSNKIHINIGGSFFNDFYDRFSNLNELFHIYFDSISINDNFKTVTELMEYLSNKRDISEVKNIIYSDENNNIQINKNNEKQDITKLPFLSFSGYDTESYFCPEFVIPISASTGCYWSKCIFCNCYDTKYRIKTVERFVDELEHLSKKYNTKYFYFWDNSLHPKYLEKMADLIKKKNLKIAYSLYARFEEEFTDYKLMKKIRESGCVGIFWGLDSASKKVLEFIQKGIKTETAEKVLKTAHKAGIANYVYIIFGLPSETKEDMNKTYAFAKKNKKYISIFNVARECLFLKGSKISQNIEYYNNLIYTDNEQRQELESKIRKDLILNVYEDYFPFTYHIIYIDKFGLKKYRILMKIYSYIMDNPKLTKIYLKFFNFIFVNLKHK